MDIEAALAGMDEELKDSGEADEFAGIDNHDQRMRAMITTRLKNAFPTSEPRSKKIKGKVSCGWTGIASNR